jgi:dolichol-phosphate mannosyltransferase
MSVAPKQALVVIPTYNEALNIERLLKAIFGLKKTTALGWQLNVLVMDDTSPDGTGVIVERLARTKYAGRLFLVSGKKEGLGRAIQKAFVAALERSEELIITMDADFSHNPQDIPRLLTKINEGYDVVYGSRYVDGAFIPGNWPISLIIRTRVASVVARWLGGAPKHVKELTGNYRAVRREILEKLDIQNVDARGYGIMLYLTNAYAKHAERITEIPITFHARAEGAPKGRIKDVVEFFKIAYHLNPDSPGKQVIRFLSVGISGTFVNLVSLWWLKENSEAPLVVVSFGAIQLSIIWNFFMHNTFTFKAFNLEVGSWKLRTLLKNFVLYEGASALTQCIILGVYSLLTWMGTYYLGAQFFGIATAFAVNYYLASNFIWSVVKAHAH